MRYVRNLIPLICLSTSLILLTGCASIKRSIMGGVVASTATPPDVIISHVGGGQVPGGTIHKQRGERVRVEIQDTETDCYSFNFRVVEETREEAASDTEFDFNETVPFEVTFWGEPLEIEIEAIRINDDAACNRGGERKAGGALPPWKVRVTTDGWDIFFSGAFTADKLNNPVFTLVPEDRDLDNDPNHTKETSGFVVTEREDREDSFRLAAAAMVHVIHTNPNRLSAFDINWVPLSFGLGVGDNSQARYFLGTGIRFGEKFFLTAGGVIGPVTRLPNKVSLGDFTTDAAVLNDPLPTRNKTAFFIGVSYSFAGVGPSAFTGPFAPVKPAPATPPPEPEPELTASIELPDPPVALAGRVATYTFRVANPDGAPALQDAVVTHDFYADGSNSTVACTATGTGADPALCTNPVTFPFTVTLNPDATYAFTVTTTFASDVHPQKSLNITVTHSDLEGGAIRTTIPVP
jgi:hypothetical protein